MCAVCRLRMCLLCCLSHGSRSTHLLPVYVPRVVLPSEPTLAAQAAREAPVIPRHHDERRVGLSCCANDKHRQLRGREERAELKGARVHADVVRKDPLGHMLAHVPPCLLNSAWLPSLDPHFFRGSPVHHPPGRQYARGTYRRRQSSSSLRTRRGQRERDGARAPWRALRAIWSISIAPEPMLELSR